MYQVPNADNTVVGHVLASFNATPIILDYFKSYNLFLDIFLWKRNATKDEAKLIRIMLKITAK
jgi:hypothetical protein